jgi:hypothetical protein
MKPINIKHFHKTPILMKLLLLIGIPICILLLVFGIVYKISELISIGVIILAAFLVGEGFFWNYGIRITSKSVTLINQQMLKVFPYEEVHCFEIVFADDVIFGKVKAKNQKAYEFYFDGVDLNSGGLFHSSLLTSNLKLTKKFVEKSIADLSTCEKVKIKNLYTQSEK